MKIYQRSSKKEFERMLIDEDYQEMEYNIRNEEEMQLQKKFEEDICWEMYRSEYNLVEKNKLKVKEYFSGNYAPLENKNWSGYNPRVVDKIERVMKEMRSGYEDDGIHQELIEEDYWDEFDKGDDCYFD